MKFTPAFATALLACVAAAAPNSGTCAFRDDICHRHADKNGLTTSSCKVGLAGCVNACQAARRRCAADAFGAADALAACDRKLEGCTGLNVADSDANERKPEGTGVAAVISSRDENSCQARDDGCRAAPGADMARCSADHAQCMGHCSKEGDACRAAPGANMADCSAAYAECLGENPYVDSE